MALNNQYCADVPLSNYSLTHSLTSSAAVPPERVTAAGNDDACAVTLVRASGTDDRCCGE